jgi:hypothetical protein
MTSTPETGIFSIETTPKFPMANAYSVERSGSNELRLPQHVQTGGSFLHSAQYAHGEMDGHDMRSLDRAVGALTNRSPHYGGLPSFDVDMDVPRNRELDEARRKLWQAALILQRVESPYAQPAYELEKTVVSEIAAENIAAARKKAREIGQSIVDITNSGNNIWLVVNPPAGDTEPNFLDEYNMGKGIKVAKLRGLAVFEENSKVYADPVVEGKWRRLGRVVAPNYRPRFGYLFV